MIEGIKRIRKAFERITERIKKTETAFDTKTDQALRLSENLEKMKEVREKMIVTGEKMSKALEERSKQKMCISDRLTPEQKKMMALTVIRAIGAKEKKRAR